MLCRRRSRSATAEPDAALVTLSATGELGEGVSCSVQTGRALAEAGLHPATGGDGSLLCSGDMLLEALVACAGVTLRAVSTSLGISVPSGRVRAEGDLDFRGTLGRRPGRAGRLQRDPVVVRARDRRRRGAAGDAQEADRALLRRLPDARQRAGADDGCRARLGAATIGGPRRGRPRACGDQRRTGRLADAASQAAFASVTPQPSSPQVAWDSMRLRARRATRRTRRRRRRSGASSANRRAPTASRLAARSASRWREKAGACA